MARYDIYDGIISNGLTLSSGTSMYISSGGTANNTVNSSGIMYIYSSGTANNTVNNGGMCIYSGGTANYTTNSYGVMYIDSGGTANNTTVNSSGIMYILSGGTADCTTVKAGGAFYIQSGGTATNVNWTPCEGYIYIHKGAYVTFTNSYSGVYFGTSGSLVSHVQNMNGKTLSYYDEMYVMSGGTATDTVLKGGCMTVSEGGVANYTNLTDGGSIRILSGGTANNITIVTGILLLEYDGYGSLSGGGSANNITIKPGGALYIGAGASATNVNWTPCEGFLYMTDNAYITFTNSYSGVYCGTSGSLVSHVQNMNGKTLSYYDEMWIMSNGTATDTYVENAMINIYGGTANSTTIYGGQMIIYSGSANNTTLGGGQMIIYSGGNANNTTFDGGQMIIYSGGNANNTTLDGGQMIIDSGGNANNITVNSGGMLTIGYATGYSDASAYQGNASNTTVNSGGTIMVNEGGSAVNIVAQSGAALGIVVAPDTYIQGTYNGSAFEMKNAAISGYTVKSGCYMNVASGGSVKNITVNSSGRIDFSTGAKGSDLTLSKGGHVGVFSFAEDKFFASINNGSAMLSEKAYISGNTINISSGGVVNNAVLNNGDMFINGIANSTIVNYGGNVYISSGGKANSTTVNSDGGMYIFSGGTANSTTVNGGYINISSGGKANSTTVNSDGGMYISSGGTANSTTVNYRGYMHISSGGSALAIKENGGCVNVADGANVTFVSNTISGLNLSDSMTVHSNTVANNTTVNSGGSMFISSGGTANSTTVNSSGHIYVYDGGMLKNTVITHGHGGDTIVIYSGGSASNTIVKNGGDLVLRGGNVSNVILSSSTIRNDQTDLFVIGGSAYEVYVYSGSWICLSSGLVENINIFSGGSSVLKSAGAIVKNTTVSSGGKMYISSGGTAVNNVIAAGGSAYIYTDATLRRTLWIGSGAYVSAGSGATVDFTVSEWTTSAGYLINDLSLIQGTPTYTITVKKNQKAGTYKLAQGADNFSGSITIGNGTIDYGTITVNGADFVHNGVTYSLDNVSGNLTLTVSGNTHPDGDLDGNGYADTVLVNTKQGYSGAWMTTGTKSVILWGNLGNVNDKVELVGMGNVKGTSTNGSDIIMKIGTTVAAWVTDKGKVKSYKELYTLKSNMNMLGIADFNGDGVTDYLLRSNSGDLGYITGDDNAWHYIKGLGNEWKISAIGDLDGDGCDDVVVRHDAGYTGTYMIDENGKISWGSLDTLKSDMTLVGTGDFNGDGVDDVLLQNKSNGWVGAWLVEDGRVDSFIGLCNNKNSIEQIADFNADGIDDIRIRTSNGDIGVLYVDGDSSSTTWKYFQSVGTEWETKFSALA